MTWIKEKIEFTPADIQIQTKRRVKLDILLFFLIMIGGWMKNKNIKGKRDHHEESSTRYNELELENWNFADGIIMSILK